MEKILYVEDDLSLIDGLKYTLEKSGYLVDNARTVKEALAFYRQNKYDLLLLDVTLPDGSGFDICKEVRNQSTVPIIFLTASDEEINVVMGLDMGGDDYITKPFNPLELIARVKSAYRRYTKYNEKSEENIIYINGLEIDQDKHICRLYETQIELTPMEFDILLYLAQKRGNVVSSEELFEKVWKEKYLENNNTVMVHIRRIREKLKENTKNPKFIKTVWGVGYKIEK